MTIWVAIALGTLLVSVLFQGFFSGSEMAFVSANRALLESQANDGHRGAALAIQMLEREDQLLGTCLIGTNVSLVTGATVVSGLVLSQGGTELLATFLFAPFALLLGEAVPKTVYQHHASTLVPIIAWPLSAAQFVFRPLLWIVGGWASLLGGVLGAENHPSRQELVMLLDADQGSDIDPRERRIIRRVLELDETNVEDAMTPLVEVRAIPGDATVDEAISMILRYGHSRLLVYRDRVDTITGMVEHTDLLLHASPGDLVSEHAVSASYVPETKSARPLLESMRESGEDMKVVVDEYGGVVGIVTMEDLLEEMFGEIHDERDRGEPTLRQLSDREWRIPGRTELDVVNARLGIHLPDGDYETIAGLMLSASGTIPQPGETVTVEDCTFTIEQGNERVVLQVRVRLPEAL